MLKQNLISDILAGLTVSFAAIALGAAFGTMSGRGAFSGMMAAAVIPIIASALGGTRLQASGPTAPLTAVTALLIAQAHDQFPETLLAEQFITLVFLLSALVMFLAGALQLGSLIRLVPNVVVFGFMNGIAGLIWADQLKKLLGLAGVIPIKGGVLINTFITVCTLALIYGIPYLLIKIKARRMIALFMPGVLVSIILMTVVTTSLFPSIEHVTLGSDANSVSNYLSSLVDYLPTPEILQWKYIVMAMPYVGQIALLAYLDSLLTALVIDQMTKEKSKLNKELIAQGLANGASALVQGIPGAQATIRSVLLIKEGARTRLAGILIGVFSLLGILLFKDYLILVAAAVFVGVLLKAGIDVFDFKFPAYYIRHKWYRGRNRNAQLALIVYTTVITIVVNLNVAVISGTIIYYLANKYLGVTDCQADLGELMEADFEEKMLDGYIAPEHHKHKVFVETTEEINVEKESR